MKVELNIDAGNVTETVTDLFKNLPEDKKHELAGEIVKGFFTMPYGAERELQERKLIEGMRDGTLCDSYDKDRFKTATDKAIREDYRFSDRMKNVKLPREEFLFNATSEVSKLVAAAVIQQIKDDPEIQKLIEVTAKEIKKDFPKFIQSAMIAWFGNNMAATMGAAASALTTSCNAIGQVDEIRKQIKGY